MDAVITVQNILSVLLERLGYPLLYYRQSRLEVLGHKTLSPWHDNEAVSPIGSIDDGELETIFKRIKEHLANMS